MKQIFRISAVFFKTAFRDKVASFWVLAYPLILILLYSMAFSGLMTNSLNAIPVAITPNHSAQVILKEIDILDLRAMEPSDAIQALKQKEVKAFIDQDLNVQVLGSGIEQSIVRSITEEIRQAQALGARALKLDYSKKLINETQVEQNPLAIIFYASFAMFSFYSYFSALGATNTLQANQSMLGQRNAVSPLKKSHGLLGCLLGSLYFSLLSTFLMLGLSEFVLKMNLIRNWPLSLLFLALGNICGLSLGLLVGITHLRDGAKTGLGIGVFLLLSFFSGMMHSDLPVMVRRYAPWLATLNPVSRISESFYRINIIGADDKLLLPAAIVLVEALIFLAMATVSLKKKSFHSL